MMKSKKQKVSLPSRPQPPRVEQVHEDIRNAADDDVVFTFKSDFLTQGSSGDSGIGNVADDEGKDETEQDDSGQKKEQEIDEFYEKALHFLQTNKRLKEAPSQLQKQCELLEEMGKKLTDAIDELKANAENSPVKQKSKPTKPKGKTPSK